MGRGSRGKAFARLEWDRAGLETPLPSKLRLQAITDPQGDASEPDEAPSRLIQGDNLGVMASLLPELEGQIGLIYADPPFFSGKSYSARIGRGEDSRQPAQWQTTEGYQDTWPQGADYLNMLFPRLQLMHRLLSDNGTLYLHLDWHASGYARLLLDEIFGPDRFLNEIVWVYHGPSPIRTAFKRKHDTILAYTKTDRYTFNPDAIRVPYDPSTVKTFASSPRAGFGRMPDLNRGKVPEDWWYFPVVARLHAERTGFPTQKPEALLERILLASTQPGDWAADFFCGSGTLPAVASRLKRRWLACDCSPMAIHTTYRRLLLSRSAFPFTVWTTRPTESQSAGLDLTRRQDCWEAHITRLASGVPFPEALDLWEIDWDYDGTVFRSRAQATRSWRSEAVPLALSFQAPFSETHHVAIRAFDRYGRLYMARGILPGA